MKKNKPICCICHKELDYKPIRLVKQEYGVGRYNQYANVCNYDICDICIRAFIKWIKKHNEEEE